ncbi:MAG TPA: hypothetical protein VGL81_07100 [Polyangiaceae bacterium]|jgi:hypothetical protein
MSAGALDASVTLDEVFSVVLQKRVPLAPELAGYLVLEIAEHADPAGGDVDPRSVFVGDEGTVALVKPKRDGATGDAEASIRAALARLLEASGSQTPALSAASKRKGGTGLAALAEELEAALIPVNRAAGRRALARLAREVKRVTLGVGRNAMPSTSESAPPSRRTSSPSHHPPPVAEPTPAPPPARAASPSFSREEEPTTARGQIPDEVMKKATPEPLDASELPTMQFEPAGRTPSPSQADVDDLISQFGVSGQSEQQHARNLKAMVGLEPTPPPPPEILRRLETREVAVQGPDSGVESLLAMGGEAPEERPESPRPAREPARRAPRSPTPPPPQRASAASMPALDERQLPTQPSSVKKMRTASPSDAKLKPKRGSGAVLVLAIGLVLGGAYATWRLLPGVMAGRATAPTPSAPAAQAAPVATSCKATLIVGDVPPHAEVLLRSGQAPIDVPDMPVGTRLEFVATAEGYAPKRVVVPAGASWDNGTDGKPRYEAGVQLEKSKAHGGANDPWPAGEPGSEVGGQGPPGTVHVVATPRGAEVWMLVGTDPAAHIEQLHCNQDFEILIAGPTTFRKRLRVSGGDFVDETAPGAPAPKVPTRVARVSAK